MRNGKGRYKVVFEFDPTGWWVVTVPSVKGCLTQARSISQGRRLIRDALSLWVDDAQKAKLIEDIRLPRAANEELARTLGEREQADSFQQKASQSTARTVRRLEKMGISLRDAAELLGISPQRVHQLLRSA